MIKKHFLTIIILSMTVISSCTSKKEIINCENTTKYSQHQKHKKYQEILDKYHKRGLTGISVLVKKEKDDIWAGIAGYKNLKAKTPIELCNTFLAGSIGKMFAGVVTMQLVEKGKIELKKTINFYLPKELTKKIIGSEKITIANLLSHTSGIVDYADDPNLLNDFMNHGMDFKRETVLEKYVYDKPLKFEPGTQYNYSNSNYELLTIILDKVLASSHANLYSKNIFEPLGLENTYYKNETNYSGLTDNGTANGHSDMDQDGNLEDATDISLIIAKGQTGSDGVVTNTHDLYVFLKNLFETKLTNKKTLQLMKEFPKKEYNFSKYKYGLGLTYRSSKKNYDLGSSIGHSGSLPGYSSEAWFFPSKKTYIILLCNDGNIFESKQSKLIDEFKKELYEVVLKN